MEDKKIYLDALDHWGDQHQLMMFVEEFSELFKELSKKLRGKRFIIDDVAEEFADVYIMLEQMRLMCNISPELIEKMKVMKLERLKKIIETDKKVRTDG